jgi:DHA2 family multidrug resistance protein
MVGAGMVRELAPGVTPARLAVFSAALMSLFIDQSFSGAFGVLQSNLGGSLGATSDEGSWMSVSYNVCYDTMILLTPWLVKRFGRRNVFSSGHLAFFVFTSYLALMPPLNQFIGARAIEGLAQGTFFVCAAMTILTLFPATYQGYTFSIFSVISLSGAAAGPFIGGWFFDNATPSTALAFYGALALIAGTIIAVLMERQKVDSAQHIDLVGVVFVFAALFGIQFVAAFGERNDWFSDTSILDFTFVACIAFAAFVFREFSTSKPLTPLRLYRIPNLAIGSVLGFGLGAPLFGANGFIIYAEQLLGFPPSTAGALLLLRIIAVVIIAPTAVMLVNADRVPVKMPVLIGFALIALSYLLLSWRITSQSEFATFVVAMIVSGAGFACSFSPIANVIVRSLPAQSAGEGVAIFKIVLVLGGAFGTTLLNILYDHDYAGFSSLLAETTTASHLGRAALSISRSVLANVVSTQAAILAYEKNLQWVAIVALAVLPVALFLRKPRPSEASKATTTANEVRNSVRAAIQKSALPTTT